MTTSVIKIKLKAVMVTLAIGTLLAIGIMTPRTGLAGPILDQSYDATPLPSGGLMGGFISSAIDLSQTFTVGTSGTLTGIEVKISRGTSGYFNGGPISIDIRTTTASGLPTLADSGTNILGTGTITQDDTYASAWGTFVPVDISDFSVTEGDVLAIVLRSDGADMASERYMWGGVDESPEYDAGAAFFRTATTSVWKVPSLIDSSTGALIELTALDYGFKTYVDVTPVPEPVTLALFGLGLAVLGILQRRKIVKRKRPTASA